MHTLVVCNEHPSLYRVPARAVDLSVATIVSASALFSPSSSSTRLSHGVGVVVVVPREGLVQLAEVDAVGEGVAAPFIVRERMTLKRNYVDLVGKLQNIGFFRTVMN